MRSAGEIAEFFYIQKGKVRLTVAAAGRFDNRVFGREVDGAVRAMMNEGLQRKGSYLGDEDEYDPGAKGSSLSAVLECLEGVQKSFMSTPMSRSDALFDRVLKILRQ